MPAAVFPTGVTSFDPDRAFACYVLYDGRDGTSILIDMNGNVVRTWPYAGFPSELIDPSLVGGERGRIFAQQGSDIFQNKALLELDWDANVVWSWNGPDGRGARQGHDQARLASGNTLVLAKQDQPREEAPAREKDVVYDVTPTGEIVWEWDSLAHLTELGFDDDAVSYMFSPSGRPRSSILNLNNMAPLGPNRRFDAGDRRFDPANIMIDSREGNVVAIIERSSGRIVWRLGPDFPAAHDFSRRRAHEGSWPRAIDVVCGQHDAHMIPAGLPGEGNVLLFDNRGSAGFPPTYTDFYPQSRVIEVDPQTMEIVWEYDAGMSGSVYWMFFSSFISSARRLPNGNTLICEGMWGRVFQVTPAGEIVWEFVNPVFGQWVDHFETAGGARSNWIYRAQPVPYDWVPDGTPRAERRILAPDLSTFRVPSGVGG